MTWNEVCADTSLADLPYRIELNRFGQIVMSPIRKSHSRFAGRISGKLTVLLPHGEPSVEPPVETTDGIKCPDVAWASDERANRRPDEFTWSIAPEICVEVLSESNSREEMEIKRRLYFESGALEVWLCDRQGAMKFFNPQGEIPGSILCPAFPASVATKS